MITPSERYAQEFRHLDRNHDGQLDSKELGPKARKVMDKNSDGRVNAKEHAAYSAFAEDRFVKTGGHLDADGDVRYDNQHAMVMPLRNRHYHNGAIEHAHEAQRKLDARTAGDVVVDVLAFIGNCFLVPLKLLVAGLLWVGGDGVAAYEIFLPKRIHEVNLLKQSVKDIPYDQGEIKKQWETLADLAGGS